MKSRMTAENNNTLNHSRFVILLRRKLTKSQTSPIRPAPIENAASRNEGGPDATGPRITSASLPLASSWTEISSQGLSSCPSALAVLPDYNSYGGQQTRNQKNLQLESKNQ
jgi:hypothetical protein